MRTKSQDIFTHKARRFSKSRDMSFSNGIAGIVSCMSK